MDTEVSRVKALADRVFGSPKTDYSGSGWYEYNCPQCAADAGSPDGKFNMAIHIDETGAYGHCWKCGCKGSLRSLVRQFGSPADVSEVSDAVRDMGAAASYRLPVKSVVNTAGPSKPEAVPLPEGFRPVSREDRDSFRALSYLYGRGISDSVIARFRIGYVGEEGTRCDCRVVIPSVSAEGFVDYWVARDYTGQAKTKVLNPKVDKKEVLFNSGRINWYEPVTLVEGPFDHIAVPNSIPLLGKRLYEDSVAYSEVVRKARSLVFVLLDDDAYSDAQQMYVQLENAMPGRVRLIECPDGYDAADYYKAYGPKGILRLMAEARRMDDFDKAMAAFGADVRNENERKGRRRSW